MTRTAKLNSFGQPTLHDLTMRFLASRSDAASGAVESSAEGVVEPHEVAAGFRVDPRTAWVDAIAPLSAGVETVANPGPVPADWAGIVNQTTSVAALPLAIGNFPQRVKDLHPLLTDTSPSELRPRSANAPLSGMTGLRAQIAQLATKHEPEALLRSAGLARGMGELRQAAEILARAEAICTGDLRPVWENERAALTWHEGRCEDALAAWGAMTETPASVFNRGMALLFLDRMAEARPMLAKAAERIPETSGWNSLARLYLALAEIHG